MIEIAFTYEKGTAMGEVVIGFGREESNRVRHGTLLIPLQASTLG